MTLPRPTLLVITDRHMARKPLTYIVAEAIDAGCRWIMLREKDMAPRARLRLTRQLAALAVPAGAILSVNGDLAAAALTGAVHLPWGQSVPEARDALGPDVLIGVSCHSRAEAAKAAAAGADYVTLSPVFPTASKPGYGPPLGLDVLAGTVRQVPLPVVALGGVDRTNAACCLSAGAAGVAIMGAVMQARVPGAATRSLHAAMRRAGR